MDTFPLLLIAHYIADFICQTRYMGENKSKYWTVLTQHVLIYTCVLAVFLYGFTFSDGWTINHERFIMFNLAAHWITDYFTSRASRWAYENKRMGTFWNIIGADQLSHGLTLYYSMKIFLAWH